MTLSEMQAELARIDAEIAALKPAQTTSAKILKKIQNTKLHARTAHKYFDLQAAYMASLKG